MHMYVYKNRNTKLVHICQLKISITKYIFMNPCCDVFNIHVFLFKLTIGI